MEHWAARASQALLEPLGDRWLHVRGVGATAEQVSRFLPEPEAEVGTRYEPGGIVMRALERATPHLMAAIERTRERLRERGLSEPVV